MCGLLVVNGAALHSPLMNASMSISGVFDGANDSFDRRRHAVNLNMTAGTLLRDALASVKCEKTQIASTDPYITEVKDVVSDTVNSALTKGGIFFVPETGEPIRVTVIAENKPARLTALIPQTLDAGIRYIEIRTKLLDNNKSLKTMKTGRFAKPLTVTA